MPRKQLEIASTIESLSILDEHGNVDKDLEPDIAEKELLDLYRAMLLGRRYDERLLDLQRQGRIGTFPPIKGQEAAQIGAVFQLRPSDWLVPSFRETAAEIWRGRSLESVLLYYNGYNEGTLLSDDQRDMPMAVPVASQLLHAVGIGYAINYRQTDGIVMTFFGDGATSEGDFHEALNCAAVFQTPVIFVCQNNQWAISVPLKKQTHTDTIAEKAPAYGMPGIMVDGNDVLAVYVAAREAAERAKSGDGPTLIECVTYRLLMHTTADDPRRYRSKEEEEMWQKKDPLPRLQNYLENKGVLDPGERTTMEESVLAEIQTAIDRAEEEMKSLGDPRDMFNHMYAELPPHMHNQKEELEHYLASGKREDRHG